jgi:hypothetical protein
LDRIRVELKAVPVFASRGDRACRDVINLSSCPVLLTC